MAQARLTRQEKKAATRQALLDSASSAVAERGFEGASIEEISERAGYSRGAFYSNFADKEECFLEVVNQRGGRHLQKIAAAFSDGDTTAERLLNGARYLDEHLAGEAEWCRLYMEAWSLASRHPHLRERFSRQYQARRDTIAELVRNLTAGGESDATTDVIPSTFIALFEGYILQTIIDGEALPDDFFTRVMKTMFLPLVRT